MTDPPDPSRRKAIKYLIGGAMAAGCPVPLGFTAPDTPATRLGSENNTICHQVRDGAEFKFPSPAREHEVVIVGGGPSGLMAAYELRGVDFLLLEKEPRFGGNAISEEWQGQWYSTGAAYASDEQLKALCAELGMKIHRIRSVDAAIVNNRLVPEFWAGGLWKSAYSEAAKKSFAKFQADMKALDLDKDREKLDAMTFAELLKPYRPELKEWFDNFGPNNWGADAENTSALIGAESVFWAGGVEPDRFTWPGGLGRIPMALEAALEKTGGGRIHKNATVVRVEPRGAGALVSYFEGSELRTVAAKTVIIACPKFIGKKIIEGLPREQFEAMDSLRYQPYLVANVCSRQVIYNGSYDTNVPAPSPIVDFNVADWVVNRDNRETKRPAVLTCFLPRPEADRIKLLDDTYVLGFGKQVVDLLNTWFPGARDKIEEVRIYRRGHPMFMSAPGVLTKLAPKIRQPFGTIFFAHSDAEGGITETASALKAARRASREALAALGKSSVQQNAAVSFVRTHPPTRGT